MKTSEVLVERADGVATVVLNRPEVYNAVNAELAARLLEAVREVAADESVRAMIVTGAGGGFCVGGDMRAAWSLVESDRDPRPYFGAVTRDIHAAVVTLRRAAKPVVAAINGAVGGIGLSIATACDLRLIAEGVKLRVAYTTVGLVPDGGWTATVARLIGPGPASELLLLDPVFGAEKALLLGLVHQVVPADQLASQAGTLAARLAQGSTTAFARAKALLNSSLYPDLETVLDREREAILELCAGSDFRDRLAAFITAQAARR